MGSSRPIWGRHELFILFLCLFCLTTLVLMASWEAFAHL